MAEESLFGTKDVALFLSLLHYGEILLTVLRRYGAFGEAREECG